MTRLWVVMLDCQHHVRAEIRPRDGSFVTCQTCQSQQMVTGAYLGDVR
jgi:hypothetical protein